jgi:AcrR family transcriptional regulator
MKTQNTRDRILEASLKIFSQKGFLRATTKEIAKRAEVAEVTIFRLFSSKNKLVQEVIRHHTFLPILQEILPDLIRMDHRQALEMIARRFLERLEERKAFIRILHAEGFRYSARVKSRYFRSMGESIHTLASYFLHCQQRGLLREFKPEIGAEAFLGMFFSLFLMQVLLPPRELKAMDREEIFREFIDIFFRGTVK